MAASSLHFVSFGALARLVIAGCVLEMATVWGHRDGPSYRLFAGERRSLALPYRLRRRPTRSSLLDGCGFPQTPPFAER